MHRVHTAPPPDVTSRCTAGRFEIQGDCLVVCSSLYWGRNCAGGSGPLRVVRGWRLCWRFRASEGCTGVEIVLEVQGFCGLYGGRNCAEGSGLLWFVRGWRLCWRFRASVGCTGVEIVLKVQGFCGLYGVEIVLKVQGFCGLYGGGDCAGGSGLLWFRLNISRRFEVS